MNVGTATDTSNAQSNKAMFDQNILGKDDFFKLLIAQLKYQDPLEPMKDREFIAQMASFSSLEQMYNLNTKFAEATEVLKQQFLPHLIMQQAGNLLGKEVEYFNCEEFGKGLVESVGIENGLPFLMVNGEKIQLGDVISIGLPSPTAKEPEGQMDQGGDDKETVNEVED